MSKINIPNLKLSIDDIDDRLKQSLIEDGSVVLVSKRFVSLVNDEERINFINELFEKYNIIVAFDNVVKDDKKSQDIRAQGNEMFKAKKYSSALNLYNESIAFAAEGSVSLALGYGNRSAVSLHLKQYSKCLEDIERAEKSGYPADLLHKLSSRRKKCEELLNNKPKTVKDQPSQSYELLQGANDEIPCASAALELCYTETMGRQIIAKTDIAPGDILAVEPAYCTAILHTQRYSRCSNCLGRSLTLIPCANCSNVMFCDEICMKEAMELHHNIECKIGNSFNILKLSKVQFISVRTVVQALSHYNSDIEALKLAIKDIEKYANCNEKTAGFTKSPDGKMTYDSKSYAPIHCLITNNAKRTVSDLFYRATVAASVLHLIRSHTDIGRSFTKDNAAFLGCLILRHLQTSACNMHTISTLEQRKNYDGDVQIGNGAFAFHSLLNHSCLPNITRNSTKINRQRIMIAVAVLPIKAGEQIYDNYGYHYAMSDRRERIRELQQQYLFECKCKACREDYQLYWKLPSLKGVSRAIISEDEMNKLKRLDRKFAGQQLNEYMSRIGVMANSLPFPNTQLCDLQETAKQCLAILAMDD